MADKKEAEKPDFKGRLRIAGYEINGHDSVAKAISKVKGIGANLADSLSKIIEKKMNVSANEKIGNLTDEQIASVEEMLYNPGNSEIPEWMLNRKKDPETGVSKHLIASDLDFQKKQDIKEEIEMRSYKGVRHMHGLTVRGQRTKTSGRKGLTLGVTRKKQQPTTAKKSAESKKKK